MQRVILHVGLPKSGTSYLQTQLAAHKTELRGAGVLYPGESWKDQVRAVRDVRQMPLRSRRHRRQVPGAWDQLAKAMRQWPGDSVVSMEWLCRAEPEQVQRILRDLAPASVEVLFTLRDLGRTIPASWQESVQNQNEWTWREFLDGLVADVPGVPRADRRFWRLHDAVALLSRWTPYLPAERVHVVTVPRPGAPPALLWERFCAVVGIDPSRFPAVGDARNQSLGVVSTELLRLLIPRARHAGLSAEDRQAVIAQQLAKRGLSGRRGQEPSLAIPADLHDWVQEQAEAEIAGITAAGVHVVGDLDELRPQLPTPVVGSQPEELDPAVLLDAALDALAIALRQRTVASKRAAAERNRTIGQQNRTVRRLTRRNRQLARRHRAAVTRMSRWESRPLRSAVRVYARCSPLLRRAARWVPRRGVS